VKILDVLRRRTTDIGENTANVRFALHYCHERAAQRLTAFNEKSLQAVKPGTTEPCPLAGRDGC